MLQYLVIVAAIISLTACGFYIRSMFYGEAKPNRISWLIWAMAPLIATIAGLSSGVRWAVLPVFMSGFSPLLVFVFSFFIKKAYWKLETFDYICGISSILALILWVLTKDANLAILFAIISDGLAAVPTIVKSWSNPETENQFAYMAGLFGAVTGFLAIQSWIFSAYAFPSYLLIINIIILLSINHRRLKLFHRKVV